MDVKDIIDIFFKAKDNMQFFWNFYVIGLVAIIGWFFTLKKHLSKVLKIFLSILFVIFMGMNISGLMRSYELIVASKTDLLALVQCADCVERGTIMSILSFYSDGYKYIVWGIHGVIDLGMFFVIWNDNVWEALRGEGS